MQKAPRLKRELERIEKNPPSGIHCYMKDTVLDILEADLIGPSGSPYENGLFKLEVKIPDNYPFEPPFFKFVTKVYHPNIDDEGRICLDILKIPPSGNWRPTVGLANVLIAIQMLLGNPNPDDPLMADIANEYRTNKEEFERKARECTEQYATQIKNKI